MIGSGLKKYALEKGMKVGHGVAYGTLGGFAATLSEGNNYKQIIFTTKFPDTEKKNQLNARLNEANLQRQFRVQNVNFATTGVGIVFLDKPGTLKKLQAFVEWFLPLLEESGAEKANICGECGLEITGGCWKLIDGIAYHMHETCAESVRRGLEEEHQTWQENQGGSYITGLIGALIGAAIGAVLWALVLNLGYVASIVGFAIGFLAEKGYGLIKGKQGRAKVVILIVAVIFGVLLGNFGADAFTLMQMITSGEMTGYALRDIPALIAFMLSASSEYASATITNILTGLLFAGLGVFALLRKAAKEVAPVKYIDLE